MPIPDFQSFMRPLLESIKDGKEHELKEVKKVLILLFKITEDELREKIPSQRAFVFDNRLGWANTYLKKAGLISSQRRAYLEITDDGKKYLEVHPGQIKISDLKKIEMFIKNETQAKKHEESIDSDKIIENTAKSPEEVIETAHEMIVANLSSEILSLVKSCSPYFFEKLVVDLLIGMGYGGSRKEAGTAIGRSGDGGIDGIINEDKLGLDSIYLQAKRWENTVPVKEIRDFAGSLLSKKAKKGVFITTSDFPKSADEFVKSIDPKIILIDGKKLATLMIENNIGVTLKDKYEIKDIDNDYFEET
ncbi:MAG: restriction endonuclease [Spirochaetaceae bacterium]|nr:restriction endonuclease [Spirochaetaceae bacterium]